MGHGRLVLRFPMVLGLDGRCLGYITGRLKKSASKILDERYAKGELTSEEYQKKKRTLSNKENEKVV